MVQKKEEKKEKKQKETIYIHEKKPEKATSPNKQKEKKERNACGYRGACTSKDNYRTKGRGFNESIKTKYEERKTNPKQTLTPEKDITTSANQTPIYHKYNIVVRSKTV